LVSSSLVLTNTWPLVLRFHSVASSGRSSMSSTIRCTSGYPSVIALANLRIRIVLPERGGATISPREPRPTGQITSSTRIDASPSTSPTA
jgi:hypothetical protein